MPADHHIETPEAFHRAVAAGCRLTAAGYLVTFGIAPKAPETGYGYIRKGPPIEGVDAFAIEAFAEKPDRATAETYLASGAYYWNSGIFLFRASTLLREMARLVPDILAACKNVVRLGRRDADFFRLDAESFAASPSDSIDYAVMEHTSSGAVTPLDAGWDDVGSWEAMWEIGKRMQMPTSR